MSRIRASAQSRVRGRCSPAALLLCCALLACGGDGATQPAAPGDGHEEETHAEDDHEHGSDEGGVLRLTAEQIEKAGITMVEAAPAAIDSGVVLLGEIRPDGDRLAHIVPRFPGIVREVRKSVGDTVHAGDVLAIVESSESLSRYEIRTLIDGIVLEKDLTLGEAVDREKQAFVVADLDKVWIMLSVYQKDLSAVRVGQGVRVSLTDDASIAEGEISYLTPSVDPVTRTATARVVLANGDGSWRPGMFVKARLLGAGAAEVAVPRSSLQRMRGEPVVFVQRDAGFERRAVRIGREGDQLVEVLSGLRAGERVAAQNTFLLKAELGKGEAKHEH